MRLLLTTHQFLPDFESGTEVLTLSVARELRSRGHDVEIMTGYPTRLELGDHERFDEYDFDGFRVHRFHHASVPMGGQTSKIEVDYNNKLAADGFAKLLKAFRPDIVHFFHFNRLGTGLIPAAVGAGVPAFFTPTDFWILCATGQLMLARGRSCSGPSRHAGNCVVHMASARLRGKGEHLVSRIPGSLGDLLAMATRSGRMWRYPYANEVNALGSRLETNVARLNLLTGIVVPTRMMERLLCRYGVGPARMVLCAYGIEALRYRSRTVEAQPGPLRIGFIGTLAPHKGCHVLLDAFKLLPSGAACLNIFGRESDRPDYSARLRELASHDSAIRFRGAFPNSEIGEVLVDIDLLVVPSVWNENTPLVIYAAHAAGCPVLGSDVPGISESVRNGIDGFLFEPGNAFALAKQIREFIERPKLLDEMRANVKPPKSITVYVDELLAFWQSRRSH